MTAEVERFAGYVATLGRGPGRSRALSRDEARDAMAIVLAGAAHPMQVGAFLMLLRYRGEDAEEITGLVQGAGPATAIAGLEVALDWPSYGAGRTRSAPWFLLSALALAQSGKRVLMHGSNEFSGGAGVEQSLAPLGLGAASDAAHAGAQIEATGFAYLPARHVSAPLAQLLGLRGLLGLRSPINTVARLINPAGAPASIDGVFHPPYIETHLAAAERLGRHRVLVLKGGGGEAERNPAKPQAVFFWQVGQGRSETVLPPLTASSAPDQAPDLADIWFGTARNEFIEARIIGTIALGLLACGDAPDADIQARAIWQQRRPTGFMATSISDCRRGATR
jgi:anthranilate phosphoribosyltransferase